MKGGVVGGRKAIDCGGWGMYFNVYFSLVEDIR